MCSVSHQLVAPNLYDAITRRPLAFAVFVGAAGTYPCTRSAHPSLDQCTSSPHRRCSRCLCSLSGRRLRHRHLLEQHSCLQAIGDHLPGHSHRLRLRCLRTSSSHQSIPDYMDHTYHFLWIIPLSYYSYKFNFNIPSFE